MADLSPGPLQFESLTLLTPVAIASCSEGTVMIANDASGLGPYLALHLLAPTHASAGTIFGAR